MTAFDAVCKGCRYRQLSYCEKADEEDNFEQSFPGLLGEMRKEINEKEKQAEVR